MDAKYLFVTFCGGKFVQVTRAVPRENLSKIVVSRDSDTVIYYKSIDGYIKGPYDGLETKLELNGNSAKTIVVENQG